MRIDNPSISGSLSFIGGNNSISATSVNLTGSFSGSVVGTFEGAFSSTATANISGAFDSVSSSLASRIADLNAATSSYLQNTTDTLTGDLTVTGTITAQEFHTEYVSASIIYESGSTQFGDSGDDTHIFSGSVGINVNSPNSALEVDGNIYLSNNNNFLLFGTASNVDAYIQSDSTQNLYLGSRDTSKLFVSSSGNVGIGTTSPSSSLHVYDSTASRLTVGQYGAPHYTQSGMAYQVIRATGTGTERALLELHSGNQGVKANVQAVGVNNTVYFGALTTSNASFGNSGDAFFFNTSDKVGLGTTTNYGKLTIKGDGSENTYSGVLRIFNSNTTDSWGGISFPDDGDVTTTSNNYYLIGRGTAISSRILSLHVPTASDYGSGSEPTIGFYSSGTDLLFNVEANTGDAYHKGSVGIGTTDPSSKLTVKGAGGNGTIRIVPTSANGEASIGYYQDTTGTTMTTRWVAGVGGWNNTNKFTIGYGNDGSDLTIDTAGKVGIGTASPARMLHVTAPDNDIAAFESDSHGLVFQDDGSRFEIVGYKQNGGTYNDIHLRADVNNTLVLKATTGNVGVGTDSPLAPLHVHASAAANGATGSFQYNTALGIEATGSQYIEMLTSGGTGGEMQGILFSDNGRNAFVGYKEYTGAVANTKGEALHLAFYDYSASDSNNGIYFGTSNTPWLGVSTTHMFIKGNGNVGIGTATPNSKLDIATTSGTAKPPALRISNASFPAYYWDIWRDNTTGYLNFGSATGGSLTTQITIKDQSGNVGIGTTDPGDKLDVRGSVLVDNGIYFRRGSTDYSTYIRSANYPSQGYTSTSDRYWVELGSKGGTHIVLNTDGGVGSALNSYDHFTIWQGAVDGDKLMVVDNVGNGYYAGKLGIDAPSPNGKLEVRVASGDTNQVRISASENVYKDVQWYDTTSGENWIWSHRIGSDSNKFQAWYNNGTSWNTEPALSLDTSNKVGIGTAGPDGQLNVWGGNAMTGGWNKTAMLSATYPVLGFASNQTKWAGIAYDYSAAMRFYVNTSSQDITSGTPALNIANNGHIGIGTYSPTQKFHLQGDGSYNFNPSSEKIDSVATIISDEMTDSAYHSILQLVSVRQSLSTGNAANGFLGFSTVDDSNGQGIRDAARIAIVNENGVARNSATALSFWTNPGGVTSTVAPTEKIRIDSAGNLKSAVNYKSAGWNWVTTPYHYYVATTSQSSVTVAVNSGFTVNGNSAIPSDAKALYVTYYYHISGYSQGSAGQGDHANDIWGPDAPSTTTSWSFTSVGNYDWGSAVFMHDGDTDAFPGYYGVWYPGAIIPVNANGNIYGLLSHGWSGGTHYHHMYVWGYAL